MSAASGKCTKSTCKIVILIRDGQDDDGKDMDSVLKQDASWKEPSERAIAKVRLTFHYEICWLDNNKPPRYTIPKFPLQVTLDFSEVKRWILRTILVSM